MKRLTLSRETVRLLTNDHLRSVWGGKVVLDDSMAGCSAELCSLGCGNTGLGCPGGPTDNPAVCVTGAVSNCQQCSGPTCAPHETC